MNDIKLKTVLKRELDNRKESMSSVARACGIAPSVLHNWLQGVKPSAKNIHHLQALSEYFEISLSLLLFNKNDTDNEESSILFSSTFKDGQTTYRLVVEKMKG